MLELNLLFRNQSFVPACYNKSDSKICFQLAIMNQIRSFFYSILVSFPQSKLRLQSQNLFPTFYYNWRRKFYFQLVLATQIQSFVSKIEVSFCYQDFVPTCCYNSNLKFLFSLVITTQIWSLFSRIKASFPKSKIFGGSKASYYKWNLKLRFQDQCFVFGIVALFPTYHQNSNLKFRFHDIWNKKALFPK